MSHAATQSYVVNFLHRIDFVFKFMSNIKNIVLFGQMNPWLGSIVSFMTLYCLSLLYTLYRYFIKKTKTQYKDKHVFITGGSTGLGLSLAQKLYKRGANITIVARNEERLQKVTSEIKKDDCGKIQYFSADMTNPDTKDIEKLIEKAETDFGPIDFLFCNAGYSLPETFLESDLSCFEKQMDLNYYGYVKMSHPVAKSMAERKSGTIVYVSSVLGIFGIPGYGGYCPSKYAVKALADSVELELKPYNVNVHLYAPGTIDTPGYQEENKMKPDLAKKIEGTASFVSICLFYIKI